jgi:hypothetical protein
VPVDGEGKPVLAQPRPDRKRAKPKQKTAYRGIIFHDLHCSAVGNLVRSQMSEQIARGITGHRTRSVFDRYNILSLEDVKEAGRKLAAFHASEKLGHRTGTVCITVQQVDSAIN